VNGLSVFSSNEQLSDVKGLFEGDLAESIKSDMERTVERIAARNAFLRRYQSNGSDLVTH
jgi:hypothetical protein